MNLAEFSFINASGVLTARVGSLRGVAGAAESAVTPSTLAAGVVDA
ncbi:hypothetical protein [Micromonospora sp. HM5-17]|nr:hypothetical protein [Micromonospora sp. HM5-17]